MALEDERVTGRLKPVRGFVLVGGWPGSGKTTLSRALAAELGVDWLSKDDFKEDLMEHLGAPPTVKKSQKLGVAAVEAAMRAAKERAGAVIDSTWYPYSLPLVRQLPGPFVEVRCRLDVTLAQERYRSRDRDPRHLDARRTDSELWGSEIAPLGVGPLLVVDTTDRVDIASVADLVRASLKNELGRTHGPKKHAHRQAPLRFQ